MRFDVRWKLTYNAEDVHVWDVIEEIINSTIQPPPKNPFKVDFNKLQNMRLLERTLAAVALINFLRKVYIRHPPYADEGNLLSGFDGQLSDGICLQYSTIYRT